MASLKVHVYRGDNAGTVSCDFRGDKFIGHEQGDEHRTVMEVDPCPDNLLELALTDGPKLNALLDSFKGLEPPAAWAAASVLGLGGEGAVGLRIGVWDD